MGILDKESKKMLVESMRSHLGGILKESATLKAAEATKKCQFVNENATYEQLLNITLNPHRTQNYLPDYVLEGAVAVLHSACLTGRKNIGKHAIVEGALRLSKKTGAVITESMMDAALTMVNEGCGLDIIGDLMKKVAVVTEAADAGFNRWMNMIRAAGWQGMDAGQKAGFISYLQSKGFNNTQEIINALNAGGNTRDIQALLQGAKLQQKMNAAGISHADWSKLNKRLQKLGAGAKPSVPGGLTNPQALNATLDQLGRRSGGRMNPLLAAGLGAAALGGGMLAYKKYKDNQNAAMEG